MGRIHLAAPGVHVAEDLQAAFGLSLLGEPVTGKQRLSVLILVPAWLQRLDKFVTLIAQRLGVVPTRVEQGITKFTIETYSASVRSRSNPSKRAFAISDIVYS